MTSGRARESARFAAWGLAAGAVATAVGALVVAWRYDTAVNFAALGITAGAGCSLLAVFILDHRPADRAAWALMATGWTVLLNVVVSVWAGVQIVSGPLVPASAVTIGLGGAQYWCLLVFLLLFPEGRRPPRPWPAVLTAYTVLAVVLAAVRIRLALRDPAATIRYLSDVSVPPPALVGVERLGGLCLGLTALLGLWSLLSRWPAAPPDTRRSLRRVLIGIAVSAALLGAALSVPGGALALDVLVVCAPLPFLFAITISMRGIYRVPGVLRPVAIYTATTVVLAAVYALVTVLVGTVAAQLRFGSALAASVATLVAAAAFRPLLAATRREVDRRFDRRAWQAVRIIHQLTAALQDGSAAPADVVTALRRALGDDSVTVTHLVAGQAVDLDGAPVEPIDGAERARREVRAGSGPVAVVEFDPRLAAAQPRLVEAVLAASSLPLQNAGLHARAAVHVAQVQASRERIVQAGDVERRRIERDLHDGAQQRLMALALRLRMSQRALPADAPVADDLSDAVTEVLATVEQLRELTRGILPPVLTDEGLAVALRTVAARMPVPIELDVKAARFPPTVEVTAWFFACEGITNAVKHAGAGTVNVRIGSSAGGLLVQVDDDGVGQARIRPGGGLQGLSDRVAAVGGRFALSSDPHSGTRLEAWLPCA